MIQSLSDKYKKHIAYPFFIIFYLQIIAPLAAMANENTRTAYAYSSSYNRLSSKNKNIINYSTEKKEIRNKNNTHLIKKSLASSLSLNKTSKTNIGGPA